jgi:hypothetical protein
MMYKKKKNNKAGLFFMLLVLGGYFFIKFGQGINSSIETRANFEEEILSQPEECTTCGSTIEEEIVPEEPEIGVLMLDEKYTVDITGEAAAGMTGEVLSGSSGLADFFDCGKYEKSGVVDSVTKLCPSGSTTLDYDKGFLEQIWDLIFGSERVEINSENSEIKFTMVTYPLAYFLGQYVVQDSNREANIESPNYSASGQAVDERYTLKTQSPLLVEELRELIHDPRRTDFGVKAEVGIVDYQDGTSEMRQDDGEIKVQNAEHNPACFCDDERISTSDFNPFDPNIQGFEGGGFFRQQIPGWTPEEEREVGCLDAPEESIKKVGIGEGAVPACIDLLEGFKGFVQSIFSRSEFDECTTETCSEEGCVEPPPCTDLKGLVVKMSPIFGDPNDCTDALCANAYLANAYKAGLNPQQSGSLVTSSSDTKKSLMLFIGTPCTANLYVKGRAFPVRLTCLWDASPLLLNYNLQSQYKSPGQEGFPPSFDYYWYLVEQAIEISADKYGLVSPKGEEDVEW